MKSILSMLLSFVCFYSLVFSQKDQVQKHYLQKGQSLLFISDFQFDITINEQSPTFIQNQAVFPYHNLTTGLKIGYAYMFSEQMMIGAKVGYLGNFRLENQENFRFLPIHGLNSDVVFRYFFTQSRANPFIEAGVGIQAQIRNLTNQIWLSAFSQEITFGLLYHVNEKICLELSNSIRHTKFNEFASGTLILVPQRISTLNPSFGIIFPV